MTQAPVPPPIKSEPAPKQEEPQPQLPPGFGMPGATSSNPSMGGMPDFSNPEVQQILNQV